MGTLHVSLHALGAQHAAIERKLLPGLEPDHVVVASLQLNAALLTAETAMSLDKFLRRIGGLVPPADRRLILKMGPEAFEGFGFVNRRNGHELPLSVEVEPSPATCACRLDRF